MYLLVVADVAQLVRAPGCGSGGRGFDSHHSPQKLIATLFGWLFVSGVTELDPPGSIPTKPESWLWGERSAMLGAKLFDDTWTSRIVRQNC